MHAWRSVPVAVPFVAGAIVIGLLSAVLTVRP
jgi:hypothetical protein